MIAPLVNLRRGGKVPQTTTCRLPDQAARVGWAQRFASLALARRGQSRMQLRSGPRRKTGRVKGCSPSLSCQIAEPDRNSRYAPSLPRGWSRPVRTRAPLRRSRRGCQPTGCSVRALRGRRSMRSSIRSLRARRSLRGRRSPRGRRSIPRPIRPSNSQATRQPGKRKRARQAPAQTERMSMKVSCWTSDEAIQIDRLGPFQPADTLFVPDCMQTSMALTRCAHVRCAIDPEHFETAAAELLASIVPEQIVTVRVLDPDGREVHSKLRRLGAWPK
jgi:hypothetical protein